MAFEAELQCVDGAGNAAGDKYSRVPRAETHDILVVLIVVQASRLHVRPGRPHHKTNQIWQIFVVQVSSLPG